MQIIIRCCLFFLSSAHSAGLSPAYTIPSAQLDNASGVIPNSCLDSSSVTMLGPSITDGEFTGSTGSITSGKFGDDRVAVSTAAVSGSWAATRILDGLGVNQIDETAFQMRVSGTCSGQTFAQGVSQTGGLTCIKAGPTWVQLGADTFTYRAAWTYVPDLQFPLLANSTYFFRFDIIFQSSATTTGIALAIESSNAPSKMAIQTAIPTSNTSTTLGSARLDNVGVATTGVDIVLANTEATLWGIIRTFSSTTLSLKFQSEVANSTVTIRSGSVGMLQAL